MKFNSARYAMTAALGVLAVSAMCNAATAEPAKWVIAVVGAIFVGLICQSVVPYNDQGDK